MTTDRELLEWAAKAAGEDAFYEWPSLWNPLKDDGDALRLAVKLGIHISPDCIHESGANEARAATRAAGYLLRELHNSDPYAATRRAIVRAAAEIGMAKND